MAHPDEVTPLYTHEAVHVQLGVGGEGGGGEMVPVGGAGGGGDATGATEPPPPAISVKMPER